MDSFNLVLAAAAIALGAIVQSISGVGGGFIMVPLLAMIDVSYLPGPMIFATLALSTLMAWRERAAIDQRNVWWIVLATLPGAAVGSWLLSRVPADRLGLIFGSMILLAIVISTLGLKPALNRATAMAAGVVAGTMGASSGIGAPAIAVLYQEKTGAGIRATLALIYTLCSLLIVGVLAAFGKFGWQGVQTGFLLMPGMLLGYLLSRPLASRFGHGSAARYGVLAVSAAAALTLIVDSL